MTKFILHGGYERKDNELNHSFYKELVRDIPDGSTVLLVYFASESEDLVRDFEEQIKVIREQAQNKDLKFILATQENFLAEVAQADAIHFRGGNTNKLLSILCTYPDLKPLLENKTVAGSSAGAYALARLGASHSEKVVREGLGLVPVRVVCHYESPDLPPSLESLSALKDMVPELELVLLRDYEWKVFSY